MWVRIPPVPLPSHGDIDQPAGVVRPRNGNVWVRIPVSPLPADAAFVYRPGSLVLSQGGRVQLPYAVLKLGAHVRWGARLSCKQLAVGSIPTVSTEISPVVQSVGWGAVNAQIQVRALVGELSRQGSLAARQRTVNPPDVGSTPTPALTSNGR